MTILILIVGDNKDEGPLSRARVEANGDDARLVVLLVPDREVNWRRVRGPRNALRRAYGDAVYATVRRLSMPYPGWSDGGDQVPRGVGLFVLLRDFRFWLKRPIVEQAVEDLVEAGRLKVGVAPPGVPANQLTPQEVWRAAYWGIKPRPILTSHQDW
jgi:hypothetical protein